MSVSYEEIQRLTEQAHEEAKKSRYALLRMSAQRFAIIETQGGSSVSDEGGPLVGYLYANFVEGGKSLTFSDAREMILRLRREEIARAA